MYNIKLINNCYRIINTTTNQTIPAPLLGSKAYKSKAWALKTIAKLEAQDTIAYAILEEIL